MMRCAVLSVAMLVSASAAVEFIFSALFASDSLSSSTDLADVPAVSPTLLRVPE